MLIIMTLQVAFLGIRVISTVMMKDTLRDTFLGIRVTCAVLIKKYTA